jgi:DtxR family Mn-dependent transcriptional regulator
MNGNKKLDEILRKLWELWEDNPGADPFNIISLFDETGLDLNHLTQKGLIESINGKLKFTRFGKNWARKIIRGHRLSECLFHDVVEVDNGQMKAVAVQMDQAVKIDIEEKMCRLLGHPTTSPHGKPIPPGNCCFEADEENEKYIVPMTDLQRGEQGIIAYLKCGNSKSIQKLMAMGILPGRPITMNRIFPSFVFTINDNLLVISADMASAIFLKNSSDNHL